MSGFLEIKYQLWSWTLELYKEENPFTLYFAFTQWFLIRSPLYIALQLIFDLYDSVHI